MYLLRRAAARAIVQQPPCQLSVLASSCRVTSPQPSIIPALYRPFHQSRIWLAEKEDQISPAETEEAGITTEAVAEEELYDEESIATEEFTDGAQRQTSAYEDAVAEEAVPAQSRQSFAEQASSVASSAAQTVRSAASEAFSTAKSALNAAPGAPAAAAHPRNKILYVGNLFFEVTAPQLEAEYARFGAITNTRIVLDARGLSKGFGYVEFAEQAGADRALRELDQAVLQGRRMAVQYHLPRDRQRGRQGSDPMNPAERAPNAPSDTLFVGNMSYQMSDRDLNDLFRDVKDVLDVRVAIDRRTGQPRGFAHAEFVDEASATRAKHDLEQKIVYGRQLRIDYSQSIKASRDQGRK